MFQHAASYNGYLTELCQAAHADEADSIGNKPVSYTHLDVYKRQRLRSLLFGQQKTVTPEFVDAPSS